MVSPPLFDLTGRSVVIPGAGGLLGQEHALAVGRAGGIPVLLDLSPEALATASRRLDAEAISHLALMVDLTSEDLIESAAAGVKQQFGAVLGAGEQRCLQPSDGRGGAGC